eukprot:scaffold31815_cov118-Isochrysis_galbana.AAC.10
MLARTQARRHGGAKGVDVDTSRWAGAGSGQTTRAVHGWRAAVHPAAVGAAAAHLEALASVVDVHLHPRARRLIEEEGSHEEDAREGGAFAAGMAGARGAGHLQVGGARVDDSALDHVIGHEVEERPGRRRSHRRPRPSYPARRLQPRLGQRVRPVYPRKAAPAQHDWRGWGRRRHRHGRLRGERVRDGPRVAEARDAQHRSCGARVQPHVNRQVLGGLGEASCGCRVRALDDERVHPPELRVGLPERRAQRAHRLAQPEQPGHRLGVRDVGFGCAQHPGAAAQLPARGGDGANLGGVAERGARAVRLDSAQRAGRAPAGAQGRKQQRTLGQPVGRRQAGAPPVLPHAAAIHRRASRRPAGLDEHRGRCLGAGVTVGSRVEGLAPAVDCEHAGHSDGEHGVRHQLEADRAHQRRRALSRPHRVRAGVQHHHARRAGRVQAQAGTLQSKREGDAAARDGDRVAGDGVH